MVRVLEFLISLVVVVLVFVVFSLFLPDRRSYEDSIDTNRSTRLVFDTLNGFKRFPDWNALRMHDPRVAYEITGPEFGAGAALSYRSRDPKVGSGSWKLVDSDDSGKVKTLKFELENEAYGTNKTMRFEIERKGRTITILQRYRVEYGWNLLGRFAGMYLTRTVGDDMDLGLKSLSALLATIPNMDYSKVDIATVQIPAQSVLYIPTTSQRNITAVETAMVNQLKWIRQVMEKNDLEAAAPYRLVTTNFGSDTYDFDLVQPIRKKGTGPAAEVEAPAVDGAADATADLASADAGAAAEAKTQGAEDLPPAALIDPESVVLEGAVLLGRSYEGNALKARYQGSPAGLPVVRDQLRAYAATHGFLVHDRAFEEYLQDIEQVSAEESTFNVYWPVR